MVSKSSSQLIKSATSTHCWVKAFARSCASLIHSLPADCQMSSNQLAGGLPTILRPSLHAKNGYSPAKDDVEDDKESAPDNIEGFTLDEGLLFGSVAVLFSLLPAGSSALGSVDNCSVPPRNSRSSSTPGGGGHAHEQNSSRATTKLEIRTGGMLVWSPCCVRVSRWLLARRLRGGCCWRRPCRRARVETKDGRITGQRPAKLYEIYLQAARVTARRQASRSACSAILPGLLFRVSSETPCPDGRFCPAHWLCCEEGCCAPATAPPRRDHENVLKELRYPWYAQW
ncbi:hypothetical protein MSG28_003143 [Choristoneura fumiferana]|uniref:Uncharacterized protein n=1 Tax=Choristoneura fumiferana TaxID=7141 RepID=A0ACC0KDJ4_CHOFU|nr:hypothetical protein MSG28_003143 [Choristoneura fumiferana]